MHLFVGWGCHSDKQTSTPDRGNDLARRVGAEDQSHVGHVFLHRSSQRRLGIASERIRLIDDDDWVSSATVLPSNIPTSQHSDIPTSALPPPTRPTRLTFEALLRIQVDLLRLRNFFEDILDDHTVVHPHITLRSARISPSMYPYPRGHLRGCELDMVV
jgi:hypothetical protein